MNSYPYSVPEPLLHEIELARRILLATHENPDADGVGSLVAFGLALAQRGRDVSWIKPETMPPPVTRLPGIDRLAAAQPGSPPADLALIFDCHRTERIGAGVVHLESVGFVGAIDHHPLDPRGTDTALAWIVEDAPSTTMMVLSLLHELYDVPLDVDQASCLYAGLLTDTGGFRHANTTHDALVAAADLVLHGADAEELAESLLHARRPPAVRLLGEALCGLEYRLGGSVAVICVDQELLSRTGARMDEAESLVSYLTGIDGVRFGVMMRELSPESWRVSLRTRGELRVDDVARAFGGGGHHRAAAFTTEGSRDEVEAALLRAFSAALDAATAA